MSTSSPQFTSTTRSKIASVLNKLAPKSRKQASKALVEQEVNSATSEVDVASILGHPMTSPLKIFNAQRSSQIPLREPAGFPVNQNFSQRVTYEISDDEANEVIFLTPYIRPSHVLPTIVLSLDETKEVPLKGSISTQRGETSTFRLDRTTRGFPTWRICSKPLEVDDTKSPIEGLTLRSHSNVLRLECSSMVSPTRGASIQVDAWSPQTPCKSVNTPRLSYISNTPSPVRDIPTPVDSTGKALTEKTYFTKPMAQSSIPFPTSPSLMPSFSRQMKSNSCLPGQSATPASSYKGQRSACYRPLGSEMMDTLDFLSELCKRPGVLAGDGESLLDGESDADGLISPLCHTF
ncbi:uncharacterized protein MELLADRAFT_67007 [Melampsora larici-populina 98AG31]|uniref:Uncharacterized protein n=1 Tax=Melampsora larici-populina (strain 98AG31 / pathotype 3-4-7) TaxID=747676 RepID=F4S1G2_MELLP|nr:uncharacterized protein MELLADRAFT_67007 [Melampsora larici-populina 98AG31]EGG01558.1 hypothetical protein MELLADRAFT_67007 [Melampsora larici-populina 98AG31]